MNPCLKHRESLLCAIQGGIWISVYLLLWGSWQSVFAAVPTVSPSCTLQRLTDTPVLSPSISADGTRIGFSSLSSEPGSTPWNPRYTESFFFIDTQTNVRTQLASHSFEDRAYFPAVKISANGERIVFTSSGNPVGDNTDGNRELFLFDVPTGTLTQITKTTAGDSFAPALNADGTRMTFLSSANLTGENADDNVEVFLFDATTNTFTQVTHTTGFFLHWSTSINADGTRIALASSADLTGDNPDSTIEIFLWDATTKTFTQITDTIQTETTSGNNLYPVINADGTRIVFQSTEDFTGENSDRGPELFLFDITTQTFTQITHIVAGYFWDFSMNADGTRIVLAGPKNMIGKAPDDDINASAESEVFLFDATTNTFTQITHSNGGSSGAPTLSVSGTRIAFTFISETILVGADLRGYDWYKDFAIDAGLFLADCALPHAQPPPLMAAIESPEAGPVSGVTAIRGWTFATQSDVQVDKVSILVDGVPISETPCCSERRDVRVVFPQFSSDHTANSGWGTVFNWGVLPSGTHTVRAQIRSTAGELFSTEPRVISVVKPGDFEYVDSFSLSEATVQIQEDELIVEGAVVRDVSNHEQKRINARFRWFEHSQSFSMVEATTRSSFAFRPLPAGWSPPLAEEAQADLDGKALASSGGIVALENPEDEQAVSGVTVIRGWAVPESEQTPLAEMRLVIDGHESSRIPCCFQRADVAAAFPNNANALNSGWGISFNYGLLSVGQHTIGILMKSRPGGLVLSPLHTVTVVKPGGFEFLDRLSLSTAQAHIEGEEIIIQKALVRDKATQQSKKIEMWLRWFTNSQSLGIVSALE